MAWRTEPSSSSFAAQTQSASRQAGGPGADDFGHELAPEAVRVPDARCATETHAAAAPSSQVLVQLSYYHVPQCWPDALIFAAFRFAASGGEPGGRTGGPSA